MKPVVMTLGDICTKGSSNLAQKDLDGNSGEYEIYGASGLIKKVNFFHQEKPYIAVVKDGAGVGRTMLLPAKTSVIGTMQYIIPNEDIDIEYLYYAITYMDLSRYYMGAAIPHIYFKDYCKEKILIPDIDIQKAIAHKFRIIDGLITARQEQLAKLDELIASRFIEMFGDPVANSKNWNISSLLSIGYCKNGMNFHTGDNGVDIRCLGVADFKNLSVIDGTENLPIVSLNELPSKDSMLKDGDIVFVRSNGNKALVGRCLLVYPHNIPTTYSGFCIRFRLTSKQVMPEYLLRVLKSDSISKKMMGRGANIQNLNQQILASLDIPIPPLDLQNQFAEFVKQTDKSKVAVQTSITKCHYLTKKGVNTHG